MLFNGTQSIILSRWGVPSMIYSVFPPLTIHLTHCTACTALKTDLAERYTVRLDAGITQLTTNFTNTIQLWRCKCRDFTALAVFDVTHYYTVCYKTLFSKSGNRSLSPAFFGAFV